MFKFWNYNSSNNMYSGGRETAGKLPPGMYSLTISNQGEPIAVRKELREDAICSFNHGPMKSVVEEIGSFWTSAEHYKKFGVTHKRGLLFHGPAGCGKTAIIGNIILDTIQREGIVCQIADNLEGFHACVPLLRQIEGNRPILGVIEDIDHVCDYSEEELLEVMDGATSLGNGVLFVATTNNLKKVPPRVRCRPSRIDTLIEIGLPTEELRLEYLQFLVSNSKFDDFSEADLKTWASKTNGFSLAAMKELLISVAIFRRPVPETIKRLKELLKEEASN